MQSRRKFFRRLPPDLPGEGVEIVSAIIMIAHHETDVDSRFPKRSELVEERVVIGGQPLQISTVPGDDQTARSAGGSRKHVGADRHQMIDRIDLRIAAELGPIAGNMRVGKQRPNVP